MRGDVSVVPLVQGLHAQEVGRGCVGRNRAPLVPEKRGCVIRGGVHCPFADVVVVRDNSVLDNRRRHFEVGVGSAASWVIEGDEVVNNVGRKTGSPNDRVACGSEGSLPEVSRQ